LKTIYVIPDLNLEVETKTDSLRPKWLIHFEDGFSFKSQYQPDDGSPPRHRIAEVKGPFYVEKISNEISQKGFVQRATLKPKGWECAWTHL